MPLLWSEADVRAVMPMPNDRLDGRRDRRILLRAKSSSGPDSLASEAHRFSGVMPHNMYPDTLSAASWSVFHDKKTRRGLPSHLATIRLSAPNTGALERSRRQGLVRSADAACPRYRRDLAREDSRISP